MMRESVLPVDLSRQFMEVYEAAAGKPAIPDWYLNLPRQPEPIDQAARIQGLATIWAEARTSFAFWEQVPDLDWDGEFRRFLPLVASEEDPAEYYRLLRRFVALLREGHSYIIEPQWLEDRVRPSVGIYPVEGRPVVIRGTGLPSGSVITQVDGVPVAERLPELLEVAVGSAPHARQLQAMGALLEGPRGTSVRVGAILPDGTERTVTLVRDGGLPGAPLLAREDLGDGVVVVRIGAWHPADVVQLFHQAFPDFEGVRALIIDLRRNGGGDSKNGDAVLARLISSPVERGEYYRPLYFGAMGGLGMGRPVLAEREYTLLPDETRPRFDGPVAVLTSMQTISAGEDFAASFRIANRGPLVGEPTAGSTGTPAIFRLPGGGVGAVSATRCVYPGRADFNGRGLEPDVAAAPTIAGLAAGRDEVLEAALKALAM